jgi:hypothetical protein
MTDMPILLPDWAAFERDYIETGIPHLIVVQQDPIVSVFIDQNSERIGARFEQSGPREEGHAFPFAEIHIDEVVGDDRRFTEIWTDARYLFGNFYRLVAEVVAAVVEEGIDPDAALAGAVKRWEALISQPSLMAEQSQAGLFGELWLLERLIAVHGVGAVDSWVGPFRQPHDFRIGDVELEVKTTSGAKRVHTINGLNQLKPSVDCSLYLLSLKLANAGTGGRTLPELVAAIESGLAGSQSALSRFRAGLTTIGYDRENALHYVRRRRLRDVPVLIPVGDGFPRLTADALEQVDPRFATERIGQVSYSIDVDGFGFAEGTEEFCAVLPEAPVNNGDV